MPTKTSTKKQPRPNVRLLRRIKKHILEEPRRLDMSDWINSSSSDAPCGTSACMAGWAIKLAGIKFYGEGFGYSKPAQRALGINDEQGDRLFYSVSWPLDFREAFRDRSKSTRAKVAAERIEHFIKTGE